MPNKPKRPCTKPGCPELTDGGRCAKHKLQERRAYDEQRGSAHERGYTSRWRGYSARYLKLHPLCVECQAVGKLTASKHTDHIKAVTGPVDPLFWDPGNHQALCKPCHSKKTVREDGGFGR